MDILTALRHQTEQAEVYTYEGESALVSFEANAIKATEMEETSGITLRAMVQGRLGFTAASGAVPEQELVNNLLASVQYGDRIPLTFPAAASGSPVRIYDSTLADAPLAHLVEIGHEIIETLLRVDEEAQISVDIERSVGHVALHNSAGAATSERASDFTVSIGVERVRGDDVLILDDAVSAISLTNSYREAVQRLVQRLTLAKRKARLRPGRMPVLFAPAGGLVLLLPILLACDGKNVQRGISPLANKLGETVFDEKLTLWDDPTLPERPGSSSYDDEGVPCRRKALILRGTCHSFLYDLKTAALLGTQSTGNGGRDLLSPPAPTPSNLVFESGATPLAEMIAGIKQGLLVEDVMGIGQGNAISGAFSNTLGLAYVIRRGEIVGRVKDVAIAGDIYTQFRDVAALSRESQWVYDNIQMPYILLPELNVVSRDEES